MSGRSMRLTRPTGRNRKMMIHWMMNNPMAIAFSGHLFDDYFKQGGGYFGAKQGLRPVNVVWDYYASGDRSRGEGLRCQPDAGSAGRG